MTQSPLNVPFRKGKPNTGKVLIMINSASKILAEKTVQKKFEVLFARRA
jgi:hypothetical protein